MEALAGFFDAVLLELALPYHDDMPALAFELRLDAFVARLVSRELLLPELDVGLGLARVLATLVLVPITAMDKHRDFPARIGDVGMARALLPVATISWPTHLAQHLAHDELGLGVGALVRDHDVMYGFAYHPPHDTA